MGVETLTHARRFSAIIAIAMVGLMVLGSFTALGSFVTQFDGQTSNDIYLTFPDGGGNSEGASMTMPAIAVAMGATLEITGSSVDQAKFTDYRKDQSTDMNYKGNYYHDFPPLSSEYNSAEMTVAKSGTGLRKYPGNYVPNFGEWDFVDNASTSANYLVDDGMDSRIVSGADTALTTYVPGPTGATWDCQGCSSAVKKSGSASKTYFPDGRLFKTATARADGDTYPYYYYAPTATVKAWNVNSKSWETLVNNVQLPSGVINDYVFFTGTWAVPRYSQIQVKISTAYSWGTYYTGFEFQGTAQGYKPSTTFTSRGVDTTVDGSMAKGWKAWNPAWTIYNATVVPDEVRQGAGGGAAGTAIDYYLSADNGTHWEQVTGNQSHAFLSTGHILRWKAVLTAPTGGAKTPAILELTIRFTRLYSLTQTFTAGKYNTKWPITAIKPMWNSTTPVGTSVIVSVSNNNGTTWAETGNGIWASLPWTIDDGIKNTELKWKAELRSSDGTLSPFLQNITIHYMQSMFPMNIKVRVDGLTEPVWTHSGYFLSTDGTNDLDGNEIVIDLNYILPHLEQGNMKIAFNVTSESAGVIHLSSLNIEYGLPPVLAQDIPAQKIDEDSGAHAKIIDLETYFTDDFDDSKLSFEIPFQEDPAKVKAWIEDKHFLSVETVKKDWYGQVRFVVRAIDSNGLKVQSNTFTISVENLNDAPKLVAVPSFRLTVGELFEYQLQWSDPDQDTWTFSAANPPNPPVLFVEPTTGKISTTPTKDKIGIYNVTYTVTDKSGASDSKIGQVDISNKNSMPTLNQIGPQFPIVSTQFRLQVTAVDPDLEYTDALTYSLKFEDMAQPTGMTIDAKMGSITWTPTKPGSYWATVIVTDKSGASDSEFVTFTVEKVNTPPRGIAITAPAESGTYDQTSLITFSAIAVDDDVSDSISYTWFDGETQFGVGQSFKTVLTTTGQHNIKVVVTDGRPHHENSTMTTVTITESKKPVVTKEKVETEKSIVASVPDSLLFLIILLVAVFAVIIVSVVYGRGGETRKKLRLLENEMKGVPPSGPQPPK